MIVPGVARASVILYLRLRSLIPPRASRRSVAFACRTHPFLRPALFLSSTFFIRLFSSLSLSLSLRWSARENEIVIAVISSGWISYLVRTENWCCINQSMYSSDDNAASTRRSLCRFVVVVVVVCPTRLAITRAAVRHEIIIICPHYLNAIRVISEWDPSVLEKVKRRKQWLIYRFYSQVLFFNPSIHLSNSYGFN